ncbi:MAG: hypothetical protein R3C14_46040 [Caldilineaceae bacterium]
MITWIILGFFGLSFASSVLVYAACVASSRADSAKQKALLRYYDEMKLNAVADTQKLMHSPQMALNV